MKFKPTFGLRLSRGFNRRIPGRGFPAWRQQAAHEMGEALTAISVCATFGTCAQGEAGTGG